MAKFYGRVAVHANICVVLHRFPQKLDPCRDYPRPLFPLGLQGRGSLSKDSVFSKNSLPRGLGKGSIYRLLYPRGAAQGIT
jgi:hypothetical protein